MFDYRFEHKCRRCGEIDDSRVMLSEDNFVPQMALLDAIQGRADQLYMNTIHLCKDGGMGITDLIGCRKTKV